MRDINASGQKMLSTFSGHRNLSGQKGLELNNQIYYRVNQIYGPSSWTVYWTVKDGEVYCTKGKNYPLHKIASIDEAFTEDGKSMSDILLSDMNVLANLCEANFYGFEVSAQTIDNNNAVLKAYFLNMDIKINYINQRRVRGWHGIEVIVGEKAYYKNISWPGTTTKGYEAIMNSIRRLVNINSLQLLAM